MSEIERLTITLPAQMATDLKKVVAAGEYASTSEIVREALRDWKTKHAIHIQELEALKADIDNGLADVAAGRVKKFMSPRHRARKKAISEPLPLQRRSGGSRLAEIWSYTRNRRPKQFPPALSKRLRQPCGPSKIFRWRARPATIWQWGYV